MDVRERHYLTLTPQAYSKKSSQRIRQGSSPARFCLNVSIDYLLGYSDDRNSRNESDNCVSNDFNKLKDFDGLITGIVELMHSSKRRMTKREEEFVFNVIKEYIEVINNKRSSGDD